MLHKIGATILGIALIFAVLPLSASAQSTAACNDYIFNRYLRIGQSDFSTGGEVSKLQRFLQRQGTFNHRVTGYFGPITAQALRSWKVREGFAFLYGGADFNFSRMDNIARQIALKECPSYTRTLHRAVLFQQQGI